MTGAPIFTEPVTPSEPNKVRSQFQIARNLKLVWVGHSGTSWGGRTRLEVYTVDTETFLGGIWDAANAVGGYSPLDILARTARELWPEHVTETDTISTIATEKP